MLSRDNDNRSIKSVQKLRFILHITYKKVVGKNCVNEFEKVDAKRKRQEGGLTFHVEYFSIGSS